ncbi:MAG: tetratricopeptide repeat protein [Anaerolineae bacterium]|nr:tetratricopeptide repeat protein [Anaerolineae bacterium]
MDEAHRISRKLEWRGYGDFALFRDTDAKIAQHKAHLADLLHTDEALITRAKHVYALAGLYWAKHDYDESFRYFQQAAKLAERLEDARFQSWCYNGLGDVHAEMGRHDEAIAAYQRALTFDATSAYSHTGLGYVYGDLLGHHEEAIAAFQHAIELGGLNAHLVSIVHNGLGNIYYALGNYEAAIAAYQRAIKADSGFLSPHDNLGNIFMRQWAFPMARRHFEERIRLRPQHSLGALVSLGIMARHEGDPESDAYFHQALESFEAAWKARYDTPAGFLEKKALALISLGRREEALRTLREMLAQRVPGDVIEFFRYELLRMAPNPPDGIDEMIALLSQ